MTRTQTRTYGVIDPSSRQPLLAAMLRAFCWLVSNIVSTCRTIFNRIARDWRTDDAHEDQFPTPNDTHRGNASGRNNRPLHWKRPFGRVPGEGPGPDSARSADKQLKRAARTDRTPAFAGDTACNIRARSLPAHPDGRRDPGRRANLVPPCSFKPAHAAHPFPDSDSHPEPVEGCRNERLHVLMPRQFRLI